MLYINPDSWNATNGIHLENEAYSAVKSENNVSVIAGPGAGKTELLTQKVGYLFETGECKPPYRILAISFKVDAAKNLASRVQERYGKEISVMFESKTFDSFTKGILDQYINALPFNYRPSKDYDLLLKDKDVNDLIKTYLKEENHNFPEWQQWYSEKVFNKTLIDVNLPVEKNEEYLYYWLTYESWGLLVKGNKYMNTSLTFPMISILTEYLLRVNPLIIKALQATYSHVFLDEFQDTTNLQYSLLKTIFFNSDTTITAVGDEKQRIMGWAGAMDNAFERFKKDFNSQEYRLHSNFRSAPKLVEIQNLFSKTISNSPIEVRAHDKWEDEEGVCEIWISKTHIKEGKEIARKIKKWIDLDGLTARDFCIIVKQQEYIYATSVMASLEELNIHSRIEKDYQELLSEEYVQLILSILKLSELDKQPSLWLKTIEWIIEIKNNNVVSMEDGNSVNIEEEFSVFIEIIRDKIKCINSDNFEDEIEKTIREIAEFVGVSELRGYYPKYNTSSYMEKLTKRVKEKLAISYKKHLNLNLAIKDFIGEFSVPVMTIHKSKGLEYNTVIFIGLEDAAFWSYESQKESDEKAFFVALSRAKQRVIFTFSENREIMDFQKLKTVRQSRETISSFYDSLVAAHVPIISIT